MVCGGFEHFELTKCALHGLRAAQVAGFELELV